MQGKTRNSQIAKNTLFLYLRMFFTMAVSLYTVRVVVKTLSVSDYGLYGAVGGVILTFGFITGVLTNASQRFFSVEIGKGSRGRVGEVFGTLFLTYLIVSIIIIVLAETIGLWFLLNKMTIPVGRESAAMWVFQFSLFSFVYSLLANPFQALIIAYERMNLYAYLSILDVALKLGIVYLLVFFDYDKLKLYALLMFLSYVVTNSIYIIYCKKNFGDLRLLSKVDKNIFRSVFSYSSWTLFGTAASMSNTQGMNILLNVFFGPIANAAYSIASQVFNTVSQFASNFYTAVKPPLIKSYTSGDYNYVHKLFLFSSKVLFILLIIVVIPIMVCAESILNIWLGSVSEYMVIFVQLSLIFATILIISYPITAVVQAGGYVKAYHSLVDGFSILALPIVYILFKLGFSAIWAYLVSIVIFSIAHGLRLYVLKKVFPVFNSYSYIKCFLIPSIGLFCVLYLVFNILSSLFFHSVILVVVYCGICSLIAFLSGFFLILSSSERKMVFHLFRNKNF